MELHHIRENGQPEYQSVTPLRGFTHPHRIVNCILALNKNNPEIALEVVFSPFLSVVPSTDTRYSKYSRYSYGVNRGVDKSTNPRSNLGLTH